LHPSETKRARRQSASRCHTSQRHALLAELAFSLFWPQWNEGAHRLLVRQSGLQAWAGELGHADAVRLLDATLQEEKKTDAA
jgi:hypothetical protein